MKIALNAQEAAEACGVSIDIIRAAYRSGRLPVHYVTTRPLILVRDLEEWIASAPQERAS